MTPTYQLETLEDAVKVATILSHSWFRGHASVAGGLAPRLFRKSFLGEALTRFRPGFEMERIEEFRRRAPLLSQIPLPTDDDKLGWLVVMQHYGMPTRLLDWTENALVALYFAVHMEPSEDAELWALLPYALNKEAIGQWGIPLNANSQHVRYLAEQPYWNGSNASFAERLGLDGPVELPCAITPPELFPRMAVQSSTFTIHPLPNEGTAIQDSLTDEKHLVRYIVPARCKQKLQQGLSQLGFDHRRLFPDLEGLSRSLNPGWLELAYSPPSPPKCAGAYEAPGNGGNASH